MDAAAGADRQIAERQSGSARPSEGAEGMGRLQLVVVRADCFDNRGRAHTVGRCGKELLAAA